MSVVCGGWRLWPPLSIITPIAHAPLLNPTFPTPLKCVQRPFSNCRWFLTHALYTHNQSRGLIIYRVSHSNLHLIATVNQCVNETNLHRAHTRNGSPRFVTFTVAPRWIKFAILVGVGWFSRPLIHSVRWQRRKPRWLNYKQAIVNKHKRCKLQCMKTV